MTQRTVFPVGLKRPKHRDDLIGWRTQAGYFKFRNDSVTTTYDLNIGDCLGYWGPFATYSRNFRLIGPKLQQMYNLYQQSEEKKDDFVILENAMSGECLYAYRNQFQRHFSYNLPFVEQGSDAAFNCLLTSDSAIIVITPIGKGSDLVCHLGTWTHEGFTLQKLLNRLPKTNKKKTKHQMEDKKQSKLNFMKKQRSNNAPRLTTLSSSYSSSLAPSSPLTSPTVIDHSQWLFPETPQQREINPEFPYFSNENDPCVLSQYD